MNAEPWNISPRDFSELLSALQFDYFKWDTYAAGGLKLIPESIILNVKEHEEIVRLSEGMAAVLAKCEDEVSSSEELKQKLAIPASLHELMKYEKKSEIQLARYDFFRTPNGGWQLSEFNEDVPGGFNEIVAIEKLHAGLHTESGSRERFSNLFLDSIPDHGRVACMYATGYSEDLQHMLVLKKLLEERGQEVVLCSPSHLQYRFFAPRVFGKKISSVVRFYPGEWFQYLPNIRDWKKSLPDLKMMTPLRRLIRQSKKLFCFWDEVQGLSIDDRKLIRNLLPETFEFGNFPIEQLRTEKDAWVIKNAFGRMGDAVSIGSLLDQKSWEEVIRDAQKNPDAFLVQKKFEVAPMQFATGIQYPALGAFLINGKFAGYYSRVHPVPFLTHEATYVPTMVKFF